MWFRPLSTQALCALELCALNRADTSWSPFNNYINMHSYIHMYIYTTGSVTQSHTTKMAKWKQYGCRTKWLEDQHKAIRYVQRDWCALVAVKMRQTHTAAAQLFKIMSPVCARLFVVILFTWSWSSQSYYSAVNASIILFTYRTILNLSVLFIVYLYNGKGCSVLPAFF